MRPTARAVGPETRDEALRFIDGIAAGGGTDIHSALTLAVEGVRVFDEYPRPLPDLFDGQMLVVAGRYERGGRARVVLGGLAADGPRRLAYDVTFDPATDPDGRPFVARVWAGMKIGFLLDQMRVLDRREKEIVDEVVRLSERYGIVTEYTAFLADEGNDFRDATANAERAQKDLEDKLARDSGGEGVNQAMNTKRLRAQQQADGQSRWNDAEGREVMVSTVRNLGRKTFYRCGGAWVDREAAEQVDEEVRQWSDRFFELVRGQRAAENAWLAFDEPVVVRLGARTVRILPAE